MVENDRIDLQVAVTSIVPDVRQMGIRQGGRIVPRRSYSRRGLLLNTEPIDVPDGISIALI